jgi:RecJ-like exonuclease
MGATCEMPTSSLKCPRCDGTGNNDDSDSSDESLCHVCDGSGKVAPPYITADDLLRDARPTTIASDVRRELEQERKV